MTRFPTLAHMLAWFAVAWTVGVAAMVAEWLVRRMEATR